METTLVEEEEKILTLSADGDELVERSLSDIKKDMHDPLSKHREKPVSERRKKTRHPAHWPLKGCLESGGRFLAMTENISENGMLIKTECQIKTGQRAYLKIASFTGGIKKTIDAVVRFKHVSLARGNFRCGAQIVKISDSNKHFIKLYAAGINPYQGIDLASPDRVTLS